MSQKCSKRLSGFTWALFECMFFSSVVLGWTWLSIVFRSDGYFTETCNVTFVNVTPPGGGSFVGVDQHLSSSGPGVEPSRRTRTRKRPCRTKREPAPLRSSAPHKDSLRPGLAKDDISLDLVKPNATLKFKSLAEGTAHERDPNAHNPLAPEIHKKAEFITALKEIDPNGGTRPGNITGKHRHAHLSRNKTLQYPHNTITAPSEMVTSYLWETSQQIPSDILEMVQLQQVKVTPPSHSRWKRERQYDPGASYSDQTFPTRPPTPQVLGYCVQQNEKIRLMFALVLIIRDLLTFPMGAFYDKHGTTKTRLLTV
ncbi:solute carrier family 43 member 3 [Elysia marginata]|uniref:Solute carrier family 43 member 3 n=1 Tax=Elysia marginata TaxID=1093978 RepID=A0AAV4ITM4_9GAST|nr:solute carrier family 43 member 3 [Elysia marginata]